MKQTIYLLTPPVGKGILTFTRLLSRIMWVGDHPGLPSYMFYLFSSESCIMTIVISKATLTSSE